MACIQNALMQYRAGTERSIKGVALIDCLCLQVPLVVDASKKKRECSVWDWTGEAIDEGAFASEYLSDFMGHKGKFPIRNILQPFCLLVLLYMLT